MCSVTRHATLVLPEWIATDIALACRQRNETAGVLLAGIARTEHGLRLLGRRLVWVSDDAYDRRTPLSLSINSRGYVDTLRLAAERGDVPIWLHTHPAPETPPVPSEYDELVDDLLRETFRVRSDADLYASIIASPAEAHFRFTGRLWESDREPVPIPRMLVAGSRIALHAAVDAPESLDVPERFDRQVRAFGGDVQRVLANLQIGVVGCGGTGSAVAEQLARLGVGRLLLVDYDVLSDSNVTRVFGSSPAEVGRSKVEVLSDHLQRIAPGTEVVTVVGSVNELETARALTSCDVAYGCTDDNAGRLVLSRLASYYSLPVFDLGVLLSSDQGLLSGVDGRISVIAPGAACLVCRGRIDLSRAAAEQLSESERAARTAEGYAPELVGVEPAVVAYTAAVASFAVAELLERLIGYGGDARPSELMLRFHDRELRTNSVGSREGHYCHPEGGDIGAGDREPFLGQTWASGGIT